MIRVNHDRTHPGEAEFLAVYEPGHYARPSVTVDLAVFTIRDGVFSVLLVERGDHPFKGRWALPGGFVRIDEDIGGRGLARARRGDRRARSRVTWSSSRPTATPSATRACGA